MMKSVKGTQTEKNLLASFAGESQARNRYTYFASVADEGEKEEWSKLYLDAENIARKEGFEEIAVQFKEIAEVEEEHEKRYRKLLANIKAGIVFKRDKKVKWHCRNCGYVHEGAEAPKECPACKHPQAYYEVLAENY